MTLQEEICALKKEKDALILAHNYQIPEIQDIADFVGDSLDLSRKAANAQEKIIVFCGVKFMAETAKILAGNSKKVLIPRLDAGCFMADMIEDEDVRILKREHPGAMVITYVNSTALVKAETDICCTSAKALKIVESAESDEVIFLPDRNLGSWVARYSKKKIHLFKGFCNVHERISPLDIIEAKKAHPNAIVLVHPECRSEVIDLADETLSTTQMLTFAHDSNHTEFIIATEGGIFHRLNKENPHKKFYSAGTVKMCFNMKKTTLEDLRDCLKEEKFEITMNDDLMEKAKKSLTSMLARS